MTTMRFGIIADDDTGASDAAGMLTEKGVRTLLYLGLSGAGATGAMPPGYDAVVVGTQIRSAQPGPAYETTAQTARRLRAAGIEKLQLKYCSTFDSTPQGNIGQSLDACLDVLEQHATIVCPALPVNGRTTYCGCHFVNGGLLSESPLRHHPLNPMTDANLVRWLGYQTKRRVCSINLADVRKGAAPLRAHLAARIADGMTYLVTDATQQSDLAVIAAATRDWPFISGGSGITSEIAATVFPAQPPRSFADRIRGLAPGMAVISGSQSPATRTQNQHALARGFSGILVDAGTAIDGSFDLLGVAAVAEAALRAGHAVLVYSQSGTAEELQRLQSLGKEHGLTETQTGARIATALAAVAAQIVNTGLVGRLVISGGETAGTVCRACGFGVIEAGLPIAPGVPYCFPLSHPRLLLALKSGNFGGEDFYFCVKNIQ